MCSAPAPAPPLWLNSHSLLSTQSSQSRIFFSYFSNNTWENCHRTLYWVIKFTLAISKPRTVSGEILGTTLDRSNELIGLLVIISSYSLGAKALWRPKFLQVKYHNMFLRYQVLNWYIWPLTDVPCVPKASQGSRIWVWTSDLWQLRKRFASLPSLPKSDCRPD